MATTAFSQGDIVRVAFPYLDRNVRRHRPALVVSRGPLGEADSLIWVAMITSAENRPWPGDRPIDEFRAAALPIPSVIRVAKLATIETRAAEVVGRIDAALVASVMQTLCNYLNGASSPKRSS